MPDMEDDQNTMVLYSAKGSSFSQRVLVGLHEKGLEYKLIELDLENGDNLKPSFIEVNPKAEVPVLVDGEQRISESYKILQYLDKKAPPNTFFPETVSPVDMKKVRKLLEKISLPTLTFGSVMHSQMTVDSHMSETEKEHRMKVIRLYTSMIDTFVKEHPEHQELYKEKRIKFSELLKTFIDARTFKIVLTEVGRVLDALENEIEEGNWLGGEFFTSNDIFLAVVLHRIEFVGLWSWFFSNDEHPNLAKYYERVKERSSFIETLKSDIVDDSTSTFSYATVIFTIGVIVFSVMVACAHLKNH